MSPDRPNATWTEDAALGGRLRLQQPRRGHRFGHDAILLAAATGAREGETAIELGAGVGAAGLALALRTPGLRLVLIEIDPELAEAARRNAERNGLADRVLALALDVTAPPEAFAAAGLRAGAADRVLMNPPFHDPAAQQPSPDPQRRGAHAAAPGTIAAWTRTAARLLRRGGALTLIYPAERLTEALAALVQDFGAIVVLPVHSKPGAPAIRILARAIKGSGGPLALLPALTLNDANGVATDEAEAILRAGATLALACD